jgi:uncharacterized membrane protein
LTVQMGMFLSCIAFLATHFLMSHPLRAPLVRAMGEKAFRGLYSLIALLTFGSMIYFYHACGRETERLWNAGDAGWIAGTILMWFGAILFVGSFIRNPALPGAPGPKGGPTGVFRVTRHPMMWSFAIWAGVHMMVLAMPKTLFFDGTIIIMALFGAAGQDAKKKRLMGDAWHEWTAQTAFVPFTGGIANPGAVALIGGTLLFFLATWLHGPIASIPAGFWRWL